MREERFEACVTIVSTISSAAIFMFNPSVLDKLRKEGWGDELDRMSEGDYDRLSDLPSVRRTTKLTDKGTSSLSTPLLRPILTTDCIPFSMDLYA